MSNRVKPDLADASEDHVVTSSSDVSVRTSVERDRVLEVPVSQDADSSESDEEVLLREVPLRSYTETRTELGRHRDTGDKENQETALVQRAGSIGERYNSCIERRGEMHEGGNCKSYKPVAAPRRSVKKDASRFVVFPRKFDGVEDWQLYKLHFLSCAESNRWSDDESCCYLKTRLIGDAALVLPQSRCWSFSALLCALDTRYGVAVPEFVTKARLRDIFQQEGQSLQAYAY